MIFSWLRSVLRGCHTPSNHLFRGEVNQGRLSWDGKLLQQSMFDIVWSSDPAFRGRLMRITDYGRGDRLNIKRLGGKDVQPGTSLKGWNSHACCKTHIYDGNARVLCSEAGDCYRRR